MLADVWAKLDRKASFDPLSGGGGLSSIIVAMGSLPWRQRKHTEVHRTYKLSVQ